MYETERDYAVSYLQLVQRAFLVVAAMQVSGRPILSGALDHGSLIIELIFSLTLFVRVHLIPASIKKSPMLYFAIFMCRFPVWSALRSRTCASHPHSSH